MVIELSVGGLLTLLGIPTAITSYNKIVVFIDRSPAAYQQAGGRPGCTGGRP